MTRRSIIAAWLICMTMVVSLTCWNVDSPPSRPLDLPDGVLRMTVLELPSHGLAIVLRTPSNRCYLIDAGEKADGTNAGRDVIAPFLRARGISRIDGMLISHPDRDHFEGAKHLLKNFGVGAVWDAGFDRKRLPRSYVRFQELAKTRSQLTSLRDGDPLDWGPDLEISVLAPPSGGVASLEKDFDNDNSIVLKIRHGEVTFLVPGDLETNGCRSLLRLHGGSLNSSVLLAPHHGFLNSPEFARAVSARDVIVSCDRFYADKKIQSPGEFSTKLYGAFGAKVHVTSWHGNIQVASDGTRCEVTREHE